MTSIQSELEQLQNQISQDDSGTRFRFRPRLHNLMDAMKKQGESIPLETRRLHEELLAESIEAQFDNLPV